MAGFFGLFGGKTKYVDGNEIQSNGKDNQEAFFLNSDEAKTLGNIEFMRKSYKIRRTFPKTQGNQVTEVVREISSLNKASAEAAPTTASQSTQATTPSQSPTTLNRRSADSSMDMFRNMARDIKK